jgi:hypothetical protein
MKFIIIAKRWFAKTYGNTYHSVSIYTDTKKGSDLVFCSGETYGYGEAYMTTAKDFLIKKGHLKEADRHNHELIRKMCFFNVSDVERRKDLDLEKVSI